ncbi:MAG: DUF115 domain-containing protein [Clostridiales bacterium]|jgi:hypothetical protein|nr:DUF115 domain-containing protein [Clostridiales bacterium]
MQGQIILFGAGQIGGHALKFYGVRNVYCFADNFKHGTFVYGKTVINAEELQKIHKNFQVVISNEGTFDAIAAQLESLGIPFSNYKDDYAKYLENQKKFKIFNPQIFALKNIHKGKKIFLIGNGPSLNVTDLEKVQQAGFFTMACNFINKIFDKTLWRPNYYCCTEASAIALNREFIENSPEIPKFIRSYEAEDYLKNDGSILWFAQSNKCEISENLEYAVNDYFTVMIILIQFAIYMGFSEIFLLGVDNTQPPSVHATDFMDAHAHFYEEEADVLKKRRDIMGHLAIENDYKIYQSHCNDGYRRARNYAEKHGIKIQNATHGGALEVFERIDLDKLLNETSVNEP